MKYGDSMKIVIVGGAVAAAVAAAVAVTVPAALSPTEYTQICISKEFQDGLLLMNETERLLMFTNLTPEQEAIIEPQTEHCESLRIDNNHTAMSQSSSCFRNVAEQTGQLRADNLREILAVANQTIDLSEYTYTQFQTDHIHRLYRDCLWDEINYYYYLTDETVETCRNEIHSFMRGK